MLLGLYIVVAAQPQDVYSEFRLHFNDYYHYGVDSRFNFKPMKIGFIDKDILYLVGDIGSGGSVLRLRGLVPGLQCILFSMD